MPLDISGFVAPEQKFEGLYKIGEEAGKEKEKKVAAAAEAKVKADANKKKMATTLKSLMDDKDLYSGTLYDPQINKKFYEAYAKGNEFIEQNPNANEVQLTAQMIPYLRDLSSYSIGAKTGKSYIENTMKSIPDDAGIDKQKLQEDVVNTVYKNPDGTIKNVIDLPTSPYENPVPQMLSASPEKYATTKFMDEWIGKQKDETRSFKVKTGATGGGGRLKETEVTVTGKPYMQPKMVNGKLVTDENGFGELEPRHDIAQEAKQDITIDGTPVKITTDQDYNDYMTHHPNAPLWIEGQLNSHLKDYKDKTGKDIAPNSPQADLVRKSILWNYLDSKSGGTFKIEKSNVVALEPKERGGGGGYDPTAGGKTSGVLWDELQDLKVMAKGATTPKAIIKQGAVTTADGKPYNGVLEIDITNLPGNMVPVMKAGGIPIKGQKGNTYEFEVKDGIINAMQTEKGRVTRDDMVRNQEVFDKERKGEKFSWGVKLTESAKEKAAGIYKNVSGALKKIVPKKGQTKAKDPLGLGL